MQRIMFVYPDGKTTYGMFEDGEDGAFFVFLNKRFDIKEVAKTGAIVAVNDPALLKRFNELGMPCRPTAKQYTISISVQEETKARLKKASAKLQRSVSNILEELALKWLDENKM